MKLNFETSKDYKIFRDWLLSVDNLSLRDIGNQLQIMGFSSCSNLASSYAFFLSEYEAQKNNQNLERAIICLQRFIIHEFMAMYDYYPCFDSAGVFGYSSSRAQNFD